MSKRPDIADHLEHIARVSQQPGADQWVCMIDTVLLRAAKVIREQRAEIERLKSPLFGGVP